MKPRKLDEIIESFRNVLQTSGSPLASFSKYTNVYQIFRALASVISEQEVAINEHTNSFYITTAQGVELDRRANDFGLVRKIGTPSSGHVLARSNSAANVFLPKGVILTHAPTRFQFETTVSSTVVSSRESLIVVNGITASSNSNLESGTKLYSISYPNIEFVVGRYRNPTTKATEGNLVYGQEAESDSQLRNRLRTYITNLGKGTTRSLQEAILSIPAISKVYIKEHLPTSGYATAYVNSRDEIVLRQVRSVVSINKPAGVAVLVKPLKLTGINLAITVTIDNPLLYNRILSDSKSILTNLFDTLTVGQGVTKSMILTALGSLRNSKSVILNDPTEDILINNDETLVLSNIDVNVLIDNNGT